LRTVPGIFRNQRHCARSRVELGFRDEFCARAISPMAEKNGCEWPFALRNDQIGRHRPALRTGVGDVVKSASVELLDYLILNVEWNFRVIIENMGCSFVV